MAEKGLGVIFFTCCLIMVLTPDLGQGETRGKGFEDSIKLPAPTPKSTVSLEETLQQRRSVRDYSHAALALAEVSQLLWAAQGITGPEGQRTAPSAGALYPLEIYVVAGQVAGLDPGIYLYNPQSHELTLVAAGDKRGELYSAALGQSCLREAPVVFVMTAIYERTTTKYSDRGVQYAHIEAGCAAENLLLQATALDLGAVYVGAFHDDKVSKVLNLKASEQPLAIIPVGKIK